MTEKAAGEKQKQESKERESLTNALQIVLPPEKKPEVPQPKPPLPPPPKPVTPTPAKSPEKKEAFEVPESELRALFKDEA